MDLKEAGKGALQSVESGINGLSRFAKLERNLAFLCFFIPLWLIMADGWNVRNSISAYYDMTKAHVFFVPLTIAAMLFIVNGLVKKKSLYNMYLGVMLLGVVLFNQTDYQVLHLISAIGFFLGNAFVILVFSSKKERWFKGTLVAIILAALVASLFGLLSLFWAESISLAIIALHYILESFGVID